MKHFKTYGQFLNEAKDNLYLQLHKKYAEQIKGLKAKKIKKLTDLVSVQRWSMEDREDYFDMDPKRRKELSAEYDNERKMFKKYVGGDESVMLPKGTEALPESVNEAKTYRLYMNSDADEPKEISYEEYFESGTKAAMIKKAKEYAKDKTNQYGDPIKIVVASEDDIDDVVWTNESVNEAKEITKNLKDVEDGDVVVLGRNKHFKVDYIDPWSAGGRILVGKDVKTGKKAKLKIKFLTARGNTGLADDTMITVLESITEGFHTFDGEMAMDLEDRGTKFKRGDKVTLEIQPNYYVIYGPNRKQISLDKQDFDPETLQQYVIYESVNENPAYKWRETSYRFPPALIAALAADKTNESEVNETKLQRGDKITIEFDDEDGDYKAGDYTIIGGKKGGKELEGMGIKIFMTDKELNSIEYTINEAKMPVNKENIEHYIGAYGVDDDPYDVAVEIGGQYGWTQRDIEKAEKLIRKHYIR